METIVKLQVLDTVLIAIRPYIVMVSRSLDSDLSSGSHEDDDSMRETAEVPGKRGVVLALLLASYSLVYFHRTMTGVMETEVTSIAMRHGYDPTFLLSVLASLYFYSYSLSQFAVGSLIDYYGIRKVGSALLILLALGTLLMVPQEPAAMVLGRAVVGFASVAAFLSYQRSLSLHYRPEEQVRATALALVAGNFTAVIATYPLRCALDLVGLAGTLTALAIITLVLSTAVLLTSADSRSGGSLREYFTKTRTNLRIVVADKHSWAVSVGALATYGTGLSFQSSWGQLFLSKAFGLSKVEVSYYLLILATVFMASCPVAGYLSDKVIKKRKPLLIVSAATMTFFWLLLLVSSTTRSLVLLQISLLCLGISLGPHIVISVLMREAHGPARAATSVAFMNTILFLGTAVLNNVLPQLSFDRAVGVSAALSATGAITVRLFARETFNKRGKLA